MKAMLSILAVLLLVTTAEAQLFSGGRNVGGGTISAGRGTAFGSGGSAAGATTQQQDAGQITGNERFLRNNRQGAFVGADSGDSTSLNANSQNAGVGGLGAPGGLGGAGGLNNRGGLGGLGGNRLGGNNGLGNLFGGNRGVGGFNNQPQVRTRLVLGFDAPNSATSQKAVKLQGMLTRTRGIDRLTELAVTLEDGTFVLRGKVATAGDRAMAEQLARLEPGVDQIRNELVVGTPAR